MSKNKIIRFLIAAIMLFVAIYIIIYIIFIIDGPFPIGTGIKKSDWLIFTSGYLTLIGTLIITFAVYYQNKEFKEIEFEKARYSQLPYFNLIKAEIDKEFELTENGYLLDCPSLVNENDVLNWYGKETNGNVAVCPKNNTKFEAVYKIKNFGIGTAMKVSLKHNNAEYHYKEHLKIDDSVFFRIDIGKLKRESQSLILIFHFYDIYNNEYEQKLICDFKIEGSQFSFGISQKQFEPELVKNTKR